MFDTAIGLIPDHPILSLTYLSSGFSTATAGTKFLASVVRTLHSPFHWVNLYPTDKYYGKRLRYPLSNWGLVKSVFKTAPKSFFSTLTLAPGFEYAP